jgi:hypothetical protein
MAEQKIHEREVRRAREAISWDGEAKAAKRFGAHSPEFQKAQQDRQRTLSQAGSKQRQLHQNTKESTMTQQDDKKSPAQQRSAQAQRSAAQQRAQAMKQRQAQQNARIREQSAKSKSQGAGMGM